MTVTYNSTLVGSSTTFVHYVRFRLGDTSTSGNALLQDEEIAAMTTLYGKVGGAAAAAEAIAAQYARKADTTMGKLRIALSQRADAMMALAKRLRAEASGTIPTAGSYAGPWMGSLSISGKDTETDDADRVPPRFFSDQFDTIHRRHREPNIST